MKAKRILSLFMALVFMVSIFPVNALATDEAAVPTDAEKVIAAPAEGDASVPADARNYQNVRFDVKDSRDDFKYEVYDNDGYRIDTIYDDDYIHLVEGDYKVVATSLDDKYLTMTDYFTVDKYDTSTKYVSLSKRYSSNSDKYRYGKHYVYFEVDGTRDDFKYEIYTRSGKYIDKVSSSAYLEDGDYEVVAISLDHDYKISKNFTLDYYDSKDKTVTLHYSDRDNYYNRRYGKDISGVNVYYDRVDGYAEANSTVTLYKNGSYKASAKADSDGYFKIYYDFADKYDRYDRYDYRYDRYRGYSWRDEVSVKDYSHYSIEGYTTRSTYVYAIDENGRTVGSGKSDSDGDYYISFDRYVENPSKVRVYKDYYDGYYYDYRYYDFYDLSDYKLVSERYNSTDTYYLSNSDIKDGYWDDDWRRSDDKYDVKKKNEIKIEEHSKNEEPKKATDIVAAANTKYLSGSGVNGYATVMVLDTNELLIGSVTADSRGKFKVDLNRNLKSGETVKIITALTNGKKTTTTFTVAGKLEDNKFDIVNEFKIGSTSYKVTENGNVTTKQIDVAPYIKNGRTMLPVRFVAESLGFNVTYDNKTRNAMFTNAGRVLIVNIDTKNVTVDGKAFALSVDPEIVDGRIMLPVSEIGKALDLTTGNIGDNKNIEWNQNDKTVVIQRNK